MTLNDTGLVPNPLSDKFALADLPRYAPWVAERIDAVGADKIRDFLVSSGQDPDEPQLMTTWFGALTRCEGSFWTEQGYWDAA